MSDTRPAACEPTADPFGVLHAATAVLRAWQAQPSAWLAPTQRYAIDVQRVVLQTALAACCVPAPRVISKAPADPRYAHPAWRNVPYFSLLKQLSLLQVRWTDEALRSNPRLPARERRTVAFWLRQLQDACAPPNFLLTNPAALDELVRTDGRSLWSGLRMLAEDLCAGEVRMAPRHALALGRDLAATPGAVVYRNALIELIQYAPATREVRRTPIVIVPPWINKYYVLDLTPEQSLVRHLVAAGYTVFIVSWRNPGPALAGTTFEDYVMSGALRAVEAARGICGVPSVHAAGYCIGGTALAMLMAWLAADPADAPVAHWTLLSALTDFAEPGPIQALVNEQSVETICALMASRGYLDGRQLALTFRMLRANSLIWHYVEHNYLRGTEPPPSAVLQWNMDATRLPAAMHAWYLRACYLENRLCRPGAIALAGRAIDLGRIRQPLYAVGCEEDHIAPWASTFATTRLVGGPVRYALTTSGHILGIVNPPVHPPRRAYRAGEAGARHGCPDTIVAAARWRDRLAPVSGSWWDDWTAWLAERCGPAVPARAPGGPAYPRLDDAPGTYVHEL